MIEQQIKREEFIRRRSTFVSRPSFVQLNIRRSSIRERRNSQCSLSSSLESHSPPKKKQLSKFQSTALKLKRRRQERDQKKTIVGQQKLSPEQIYLP